MCFLQLQLFMPFTSQKFLWKCFFLVCLLSGNGSLGRNAYSSLYFSMWWIGVLTHLWMNLKARLFTVTDLLQSCRSQCTFITLSTVTVVTVKKMCWIRKRQNKVKKKIVTRQDEAVFTTSMAYSRFGFRLSQLKNKRLHVYVAYRYYQHL